MKKMTATCTWALAAVLATGVLLAAAPTSYADHRNRDADRGTPRSNHDDHRYVDRSGNRGDRDFNRPGICGNQPWDGRDRDWGMQRPPICQVQTVYLIPVRVISYPRVVFQTPCLFVSFGYRW